MAGGKQDGSGTEEARAHAFPFVGAGEAQYFEWAEVWVRFRTAPSAAERKEIAGHVPAPIGDLRWDGAVLHASSDQAVGRQISAAYGPKAKLPAALTNLNRFQAAASSKVASFNAHIELWLEQAHALCPILVAYRREDHEAGGTKLSPWHHASVAAIPGALSVMVAEPCALDGELGKRLADAAKAAGIALDASLPEELRKLCAPLLAAQQATEDAASDEALRRWLEAALAVPDGYDASTLPVADEASVLAALEGLRVHLPKVAKRLQAMPREARRLRPGATRAALAETEAALGAPLAPEHRALLEAFDGGTIGELVLLGTEAGGARGPDAIVAFSRAVGGRPPVPAVMRDGMSHVDTKRSGKGAQLLVSLGPGQYELTKTSPKLDNLLDAQLAAGKMRASWQT